MTKDDTDDTKVSLRDYLNERINNLEEKVDSSQATNSKALELQAAETERRLESLNGEAGRLAKVLDQSIPREVHDRDMKELRSLIDVLTLAGQKWVTQDYLAGILKEPNNDIRSLASTRDVQTGKSLQSAVTLALIFSIISAIGGLIGIIGFLRTL